MFNESVRIEIKSNDGAGKDEYRWHAVAYLPYIFKNAHGIHSEVGQPHIGCFGVTADEALNGLLILLGKAALCLRDPVERTEEND